MNAPRLALLTTMCWGIYLVVTQLRCVDAAAAIARQAARGDTSAVAKAKAAAPSEATIAIESAGGSGAGCW